MQRRGRSGRCRDTSREVEGRSVYGQRSECKCVCVSVRARERVLRAANPNNVCTTCYGEKCGSARRVHGNTLLAKSMDGCVPVDHLCTHREEAFMPSICRDRRATIPSNEVCALLVAIFTRSIVTLLF